MKVFDNLPAALAEAGTSLDQIHAKRFGARGGLSLTRTLEEAHRATG
ncbi:hypothetical protein [Bradyrhizobium sp. WD16]|nr:hypothetical protein [Bradyrhizobium sp. WD16]